MVVTRLARRLVGDHTGDLTREVVTQARAGTHFQVTRLHGLDRTYDRRFLLRTVSGHDHIVQTLVVLFEFDVDRGFRSYFDCLRFVTDTLENEFGRGGNVYGVLTVDIGVHTIGFVTLFDYGSADYRTVLVSNGTANRNLLCISIYRKEQCDCRKYRNCRRS